MFVLILRVMFSPSRCFTSRFLVLLMLSCGLATFGLSSKRQAGTRRVRDTRPGARRGNAPARCDSSSTVRAALTSRRRVLTHNPSDKTVSNRPKGVLVSRSTDKPAWTTHRSASVYRRPTWANQRLKTRKRESPPTGRRFFKQRRDFVFGFI